MTLGQSIKAARLAAHISQEQLAEKIPISASAISHYEKDRHLPSVETLEKIAEVLGVSVEKLTNSEVPLRTGRVREKEFADIDEEGRVLPRRIWKAIMDCNKDSNRHRGWE